MRGLLVRTTILVVAAVVWFVGLRLFLQSDVSRRKKVGWTAFLFLVGIGIGVVLPLSQIWSKFLFLIVLLPVLGLADVLLLRSDRGPSFWIRACGFEVCTVFGAALAARFLLDLAGVAALVVLAGASGYIDCDYFISPYLSEKSATVATSISCLFSLHPTWRVFSAQYPTHHKTQ